MSAASRRDPVLVAWASSVVRRFAAATNMLVAGRRFRLDDADADPFGAEELAALLVALGARPAVTGEPADQIWCVGHPESGARAAVAAGQGNGDGTVIVVDAGRCGSSVDEAALAPLRFTRPGVRAVPVVSDRVFLVAPERGAVRESRPTPGTAASARIAWARQGMPIARSVARSLLDGRRLAGVRVGVALVLEPKTAVLSLLLAEAGADVVVYAHADETDDAVAAALRESGIAVYASSRASVVDQRALALRMLDARPSILLDDGAHVIRLAHAERPDLVGSMVGASEETTSGLRPLRAMAARGELGLPVVAANDARTKTLFDNRYGTGQSCVFAVLDVLDRLPAGVVHRCRAGGIAVVAGFGPVGEGVAMVLDALGMRVVVAEVDPVRALQAVVAGYAVAALRDAVVSADLLVSATGVPDTVSLDVLSRVAEGAVVAVAGGVEQEVALGAAVAAGGVRRGVAPDVEALDFPDGRSLMVLADGGCVNIVAAEGNPIEIMDLSFAVQLGAVGMLVDRGADLPNGVVPVDSDVDIRAARLALAAFGARGGGVAAWDGATGSAPDAETDSGGAVSARFGSV